MSVTLAPRARRLVKASWPGVSMKTMDPRRRFQLVGADLLGDAAGLLFGHARLAQGVQQRGLAVVDVAHDGDHRRPRRQHAAALGHLGLEDVVLEGQDLEGDAVVGAQLLDVGADHDLVALVVHLQLGHLFFEELQLDGQLFGQFLDRAEIGDLDLGRQVEGLDDLFLFRRVRTGSAAATAGAGLAAGR